MADKMFVTSIYFLGLRLRGTVDLVVNNYSISDMGGKLPRLQGSMLNGNTTTSKLEPIYKIYKSSN